MNQKFCLIVILVFASLKSSLFAAAPPLIGWQKCIGGSLHDFPGALIKSQDGNTLLLSNVNSNNGDIIYNHGSTDILLTKLDQSGTILWQKSIGGSSIDVGTGISELSNGNIIISGYTSSLNGDIPFNLGTFDVFLISLDSTGNILWTGIYGGSKVDLCYSQLQTKDGGFVLGGGSYSFNGDVSTNHGDQDFWIIKTDSIGNLLWQKSSGGSGIDVCYSLAKDDSGNIFACGTTNSSDGDIALSHGNYDLWVIKYDATGNILWNKTFGGTNYETAQTIFIGNKNQILIGGYTRSSNSDVLLNFGFGDSWIIQIDEAGNLLKQKNFGGSGSDNLYSIIGTTDGGYLFTSGTTSTDINIQNSYGQEDIWLYKTDGSLNEEWSHNYGGSGNDRPVNVIQNSDGGFLLTGYTFSNNNNVSGQHGSADIWLLNLVCKIPSSFYSTQSEACLGDTLSFSNESTFAAEGSWFLNNVFYSKENAIQINFTTTGIYQLNLNVQTCYHSSDFNTNISVRDCNLPVVNFSTQSNMICANSQVKFTDASTKATSWLWQFPGGDPVTSTLEHPITTYKQPGIYNVMLTVSNTHGNQTAMRLNFITVNQLPSVPEIIINGNELISSPAIQYQWYFNNSLIPTETFQNYASNNPGYYQVQIWDSNQCSNLSTAVYFSSTGIEDDLFSNEISIFPNPAINKINVKLHSNSEGSLRIINMNGQLIFEKNIFKNEGQLPIDLLQYPVGIYKVLFTNSIGKTIQKSILIN